jgi:hypothetical protein
MDGEQLHEDDHEPAGFDRGSGSALLRRQGGWPLSRFSSGATATLTLIERKEGTTKAWGDTSGGALGSVGLATFALITFLLLRWNPVAALLLALLVWALVSGGLYALFRVTGLFLEQDQLLAKRR